MKLIRRLAALLTAAALLLCSVCAAEPASSLEENAQDWNLLLINPWNPLPEDFTVQLVTLSGGWQVDQRVAEDLLRMLEDCRAAGLHPEICSAYRTQAQQTYLHENKISRLRAAGWDWDDAPREAARWVAVPGTSEHQTGMAVDLVSASYRVLDEKQAETPEQQWLMAHCWEYGFILRYAADKCELTGIGYEPWHYRYIGQEAALAMRDSGQCLEEYLETLRLEAVPEEEPVPEEPATPLPEAVRGVRSLYGYLESCLRELRRR